MSGCHVPIECHCKCHVSQNECCDACPSSLAFKVKELEGFIHAHWDLNYKSDENLSKRILELDEKLERSRDTIGCLDNAYNDACLDLEKRVIKLETNKYVRQEQYFVNKKPHKCPVCNGYGSMLITEKTSVAPADHYRRQNPCASCEGKGIVWG